MTRYAVVDSKNQPVLYVVDGIESARQYLRCVRELQKLGDCSPDDFNDVYRVAIIKDNGDISNI